MKLFGKHRVRAAFYHISALVFLGTTCLYTADIVSTEQSYYITAILFVVDYLAELLDPHPDNMGPWYKRYFHRAYDGTED